jgi:hypothetical protein
MLEKIDLGGPVFIDFIENEYATKVLSIWLHFRCFLDDFRCFVLEFLMLTVQDFHGWFKW